MTIEDTNTGTAPAAETPAPASTPAETAQPASTEATSSAPTTTDTSPAPQGAENKNADGKAAGEEKQTLLDAVLKAVEAPPAKVPDSEAKAETKDAAEATDPQGEAEDETVDDGEIPELTEEDFKTRRKFSRRVVKQLYRQMNHYKTQAQTAVELNDLLRENRINSDEFGDVLAAMVALKRGQMDEFLQIVGPSVELALQATGRLVPPDVQQLVDQGHMTTEAARRYAQEQINRQIVEAQRADMEHERIVEQQFAQRDQAIRATRAQVAQWETAVKAKDPEYARKSDLVLTHVNALLHQHTLRGGEVNPQIVHGILEEAYNRANHQVQQFQPRPQPTQRQPSSVHSNGPGASRAPNSFMDAVKLGLERSRA